MDGKAPGTGSGPVSDRARGAEIPLERDLFLRTLVRELAGTLEDVVGIDEASGFVSVVGQGIGRWIDAEYSRALGGDWRPEDVAAVLVDLKRRIRGDFYVISVDDEKIVLGNRACPFGDKVVGRPSMCMMTSNVFGHITAEHLGYARVALEETIADGAQGCRVTVHLSAPREPSANDEREYFASSERDGDG